MDKNNILPVTDARRQLYALVKACRGRALNFVLTSGGEAVARLMGEEEYESLMETLEVLSDRKQIQRLTSSLKHAESGKLYTHEEVFGHKKSRPRH